MRLKLATFSVNGSIRIGKVIDDRVIDVTRACGNVPPDIAGLLSDGGLALKQIERIDASGDAYLLRDVELHSPISQPSKFLGIGANYPAHVAEAAAKGVKLPSEQIWFNKQVSCITGPYSPVFKPAVTEQLDWEVELAVVIGRKCRHVSVEDAPGVIAGYSVTNDFSCRDWQVKTPTWTLAKSFDSFGPIGPWLVTADEIPDPHDLEIRLWVNGQLKQNSSTRLMIHNIYQQIAYLTTVCTLEPGDIIATGTPSGVAFGMANPTYLNVGDVVRAEIEAIGAIENRIEADLGNTAVVELGS